MENEVKMQRGNRVLTWVLRSLLILVILFFMLFSLDVFTEDASAWEMAMGFLMHNIPSFIMIAILIVAWKWEHIAGILLIVLAIGMMFFFGGPMDMMYGTWIMLSLPTILGILFLLNYYCINSGARSASP